MPVLTRAGARNKTYSKAASPKRHYTRTHGNTNAQPLPSNRSKSSKQTKKAVSKERSGSTTPTNRPTEKSGSTTPTNRHTDQNSGSATPTNQPIPPLNRRSERLSKFLQCHNERCLARRNGHIPPKPILCQHVKHILKNKELPARVEERRQTSRLPVIKRAVTLKLVERYCHEARMMASKRNLRKPRPKWKTSRRSKKIVIAPMRPQEYGISDRNRRFIENLGIPILANNDSAFNLSQCLQALNWDIKLESDVYTWLQPKSALPNAKNVQKDKGRPVVQSRKARRRRNYNRKAIKIPLAVPPTSDLGIELEKTRKKLITRFEYGILQISADWEEKLYGRGPGILDSDVPRGGSPQGSNASSETVKGNSNKVIRIKDTVGDVQVKTPSNAATPAALPEPHSQTTSASNKRDSLTSSEANTSITTTTSGYSLEQTPPYEETTLLLDPSEMPDESLTNDWEMLVVLRPHEFLWSYQDAEGTEFRERVRHAGIFGASKEAQNVDIMESKAYSRFLLLRSDGVQEYKETGFRAVASRLIADTWATDEMPAYCSYRIQCCQLLRGSNSTVTLDVASVPSPKQPYFKPYALPVLMAAQYLYKNKRNVVEELASGFHAIMVIMILYYLDTRSTTSEPLPTWMVLHGLIFNHLGLEVYDFHPVYRSSVDGTKQGWGASSAFVTNSLDQAFTQQFLDRGRLVAALLRVKSRAHDVLRRLMGWDGYHRLVVRRCKA
ncbi:hypothetical protein M408DRAFT_266670 [Serendipita vermifera MAFF 305830]|uniref:Uncharacterized protein n=1 Tax=Serendipita vermifera MAFF 305830 TaxID=933852 RepID=A0A0C2W9E3_SERVB|nr:hypothetical protein M408DRAFT_148315 [Serendipita vermifera MAFF 305830]KIM23043.1 hypothetical protein M408DRAFT_266670 [Serendipita vermifera MAFF 305830]